MMVEPVGFEPTNGVGSAIFLQQLGQDEQVRWGLNAKVAASTPCEVIRTIGNSSGRTPLRSRKVRSE
jgi:hypothetical protein